MGDPKNYAQAYQELLSDEIIGLIKELKETSEGLTTKALEVSTIFDGLTTRFTDRGIEFLGKVKAGIDQQQLEMFQAISSFKEAREAAIENSLEELKNKIYEFEVRLVTSSNISIQEYIKHGYETKILPQFQQDLLKESTALQKIQQETNRLVRQIRPSRLLTFFIIIAFAVSIVTGFGISLAQKWIPLFYPKVIQRQIENGIFLESFWHKLSEPERKQLIELSGS